MKMAEEKSQVRISGNQLAQLGNQERVKLEEINRKVQAFQDFRAELQMAIDSLAELGKNKKGEKMLVSLGAGVYAEASIEKTDEAIFSIAGNVFKSKKSEGIAKILKNKIASINKTLEKTAQDQQKAWSRLNQIEQIMEAGRRHMQQQAKKSAQS